MKAVLQRVTKASVTIEREETRTISRGIVVLVAIGKNDDEKDGAWLSDKILSLRIFPNEQGKFDRSVTDIRGDLLVVSQFTLYGDAQKGKRPDFTSAAEPATARVLYERFVDRLRSSGLKTETGEFAADMNVKIHNDGPVTIIIDSKPKE